MTSRKTLIAALAGLFLLVSAATAQSLEDNWNDFLHYTKIGRLDLAAGYAQAVLDSNPDPVELLALAQANPQGYSILLKVIDSAPDSKLTELSEELMDIIEQGRFIRRADASIIAAEIRRLSSTDRGYLAAVKRLQNTGEYAIPYILDALADKDRKDEFSNIVRALPEIGRDSIRPLTAALQTKNVPVKAEIIKALGKIGYPQSLAHLKYVAENEGSAELRALAENSIIRIDPAAAKVSAADLFHRLAENYYYHTNSLAPQEETDSANIWFWDTENEKLYKEKVSIDYFYELMSMRANEWALKADPAFGRAIGLWVAAFFKAESAGLEMPEYFGSGHAEAAVYATTTGPEYLHQALARAVKDENAFVALGVVEALGAIAGEKSLLYRLGPAQPLVQALTFNDKAVRYSAAIAIAVAGPKTNFPESGLVVENLAQAIAETSDDAAEEQGLWSSELADEYALRAAIVMLNSAKTRNKVINLLDAQDALVNATQDKRAKMQILSGQVLAYLDTPNAQRAIAAMALKETNDINVRIFAFNSLSVSAKVNSCLLENETIDAVYSLVGSMETDPALRSAAATAYGSLDLPSQKVKDLILDQAKS